MAENVIEMKIQANLQDWYEDAKAMRDALTAQIESLEASGAVCTHPPEARERFKDSACELCTRCSHWVTGPDGKPHQRYG